MPRVTVNGVELNVFDQGSGPPVLFVHGFPLDHTMWQAQLDALAGDYRVIAPDLRGFGRSGVTAGTVSMEQFADDLNGLLDTLGIDRPVAFCGLSMGGYIAWEFARKHGGRLRSLVLCDTRAAADTPEAAAGRLKTVETVLSRGPRPLADTMPEKLFSPTTRERQPELVARVQQTILATDPEGIAAALRGMAARPDSTGLLSQIRVPALVIVGADDALTPPDEMRRLAEALPQAEFIEVPDAGHMAPMENPTAVNAALVRFLQRK